MRIEPTPTPEEAAAIAAALAVLDAERQRQQQAAAAQPPAALWKQADVTGPRRARRWGDWWR